MPTTSAAFKPEVLTDEQVRREAVGRNLDRLAWLMDRAIPIPGTKFSVGLDALLGLVPVGGDFVAGLIQAGLVLVAVQHFKVPKAVATRMMLNVLLDLGVGSIPVVGDLFDAGFKANTRNMTLLKEVRQITAAGQPVPSGPSVRYIVGIALIFALALGLILVGFATVCVLIYKALTPAAR